MRLVRLNEAYREELIGYRTGVSVVLVLWLYARLLYWNVVADNFSNSRVSPYPAS